ncbi:putative Mitochondrial substrate carrier family protein [Hibiscus syriacus]|uniref:Epidermal patterning factor-like protein n=1 Tax=Hibiscus syriacus TaxID=106335 RepID=A0A6A2WJJ9_HIBSY|nr:polygalacturonase-like [Hibiscus syriacus]KAE8659563.1 putative Mitochondrial substrate carrier family protein [Hibiscus syriacus]
MEGRLFCFLLALQIVRWSCATSRPLAPNDGFGAHQPDQKPEALQVPLNSKEISMERSGAINGEGENKVGIGSSPPNCEHKCFGCTPCEAIQVPSTTSKRIHVDPQYANYEPESWKCKCGPFFYSSHNRPRCSHLRLHHISPLPV